MSSCRKVLKANGLVSRTTMLLAFSVVCLLAVCLPVHANVPIFEDVRGVVQNSITKEPLAGVTISVKGALNSTRTNSKGEFIVRGIEAGVVLVFTYVGFEEHEVKVMDPSQPLTIMMEVAQQGMDNVVVVGYGSVKKRDLTGSVARLSIDDLQKAPVRAFDEALAGRISGVMVSSTEGQPGSPTTIVIRGNNSITQDNSPLYVIDGFPIETPDNNILNPNDIESIDVLKDASATAIYGARGANGVIIVTTKKGKDGPPVVRYNSYYGVQKNLKTIPVMNPYEFVKLQQEVPNVNDLDATYLANGVTLDDYKSVSGIDWQKRLYRQAPMQDHSVSVTGGAAKTKYSMSGEVFDQDGIVVNSSFKRYQAKLSLDQTVNDKLKTGGYVLFTNTKRYGNIPSSMSSSSMNNLLYSTWGYRPVSPINSVKPFNPYYDETLYDDMVNPTTDYRLNPIIIAENEYRLKNVNNLIANAYVEYSVLKNLKLRVTGGLNKTMQRNDEFNNSRTRSGNPGSLYGMNGSVMYNEINNWLNENTLTYNGFIGNDHKINAVGGITLQGNRYQSYGSMSNQLPYEELGLAGLGFGEPQPVYPELAKWSLVSGLARVNYSFKERYLLTVSFRADGSSKFRENSKWSYFPSGAFAWRIGAEPFMQRLTFLSDAKVRASWGITGNNRVPEYGTYAKVDFPINNYYSFNNVYGQGAILAEMANPDLKWENTAQTDVGLDVGLLHHRVQFTVDYYKKITKNLLLDAGLPPTTGYPSVYRNIGKTSNEGIELSLSSINIDRNDFKWRTAFNISFNRSKTLALAQNQESMTSSLAWDQWYASIPLYITKLGMPLGQIYGFIWDGVYQYDDFDKLANDTYVLKDGVPANGNARNKIQPGDIKYRDMNGDGDVDDYDRTIIGHGFPVHIGGFTNNFSYRNFDLNVFFQWSYGNDIVNANRLIFETGNKSYLNQYASFKSRWTPENTNTTMPRAGGQVGYAYSTRIIEDGSYLRLKTVQLGYTLPESIMKNSKIKSCRFYLATQNLYTWTKYSGNDPEVSVGYSALTPGFDYSAYPRARTVTLGVNLSL
ncbi:MULTISPECIES: SusC/RagA family TonB-linked outer membrane protein [Niastella]|uniref:TonB-dependent receptor n=1 Tax=Niastella soli TaxID=2821487 RepID=A0ABS3Z251_9BACT|nr:TonB-dependent receptor [Niastella soli]MBO9204239.1 TonB-dependent receptor [Niastella soli]